MTTSTDNKPYAPTLDTFYVEVVRWTAWVTSMLGGSDIWIERANARHKDARQDSNWYQDDKGRVWANYGAEWFILTRSTEDPFSKYLREPQEGAKRRFVKGEGWKEMVLADGSTVEFVKRSLNFPDEDWTWEINPFFGTVLNYYTKSKSTTENSIELAKILDEKRSEIKVWFDVLVEEHKAFGESHENVLEALLKEFAPEFARNGRSYPLKGVHDTGALSAVLSGAFDQGVFGRQVVRYCF